MGRNLQKIGCFTPFTPYNNNYIYLKMNKLAIVASVGKTRVPGYDNKATQGADMVTYDLYQELIPAFNNIQLIQHTTTKAKIVNTLTDAAKFLDKDGFCMFYFHGHGDSLPNVLDPDGETKDQALVCQDGFLFDDEIDLLLRQFHPSHRILTITDCCASESVVEWKYEQTKNYPQVLHISACRDDQTTPADAMGGIMSRNILNSIYGAGYTNYSYLSFCQAIKSNIPNAVIRTTANVTRSFLNQKLFT